MLAQANIQVSVTTVYCVYMYVCVGICLCTGIFICVTAPLALPIEWPRTKDPLSSNDHT